MGSLASQALQTGLLCCTRAYNIAPKRAQFIVIIVTMKLYHKHHPHEPDNHVSSDVSLPIIIIPGLFGSTTNWRSFADELRKLGDVYVIDQRNHGRSPHAKSHTYEDMVNDLMAWCDIMNFDQVNLVGHSMGGKVAMCAAHWHPDRINSLVVLDIAPVEYSHSHAPFLQAMLELDLSKLESRSAADAQLKGAIPDKATRMFLLQSLTGSPGGYEWRLNLVALYEYMPAIIGFPTIESTVPLPTLVVRGSLSDYVSENAEAQFRGLFSNFEIVSISNAGHWLHVEQPQAVLASLRDFYSGLH